jgi:hypothetical protein
MGVEKWDKSALLNNLGIFIFTNYVFKKNTIKVKICLKSIFMYFSQDGLN